MRLQSIIDSLDPLGLWSFPIRFTGTSDHLEKIPLVKWKPYQTQRPSQADLECWTQRFGWASAGIPTGSGTRLLVVDCDSVEAANWYLSRGTEKTWMVRTRRGCHFYYDWPSVDIRNSASKVGLGVDVRGEGGYVVAPGSAFFFLQDRRWELFEYRWCKGRSPADLPRAAAPDWLIAQLQQKTEPKPTARINRSVSSTNAREAFDIGMNRLMTAQNGTRNQNLLEVANCYGALIELGQLNRDEVIHSVMIVVSRWVGESVAKSYSTLLRGIEHGAAIQSTAP